MNYWFLEKRLLCIKTASSFPSLFGNDIVSGPGVSTPLVSISRLASLWVGYSDSCLLENRTSLLLRLWNCYYCNQTPRNTPCCLTNSLWVSSVVSGVTSLPNHADGFTKDSWKDAILFFSVPTRCKTLHICKLRKIPPKGYRIWFSHTIIYNMRRSRGGIAFQL